MKRAAMRWSRVANASAVSANYHAWLPIGSIITACSGFTLLPFNRIGNDSGFSRLTYGNQFSPNGLYNMAVHYHADTDVYHGRSRQFMASVIFANWNFTATTIADARQRIRQAVKQYTME